VRSSVPRTSAEAGSTPSDRRPTLRAQPPRGRGAGGIARGMTNQEIADAGYVSINSVKSFIRTAYKKVGVTSRSKAVAWAIAQDLANPSDHSSTAKAHPAPPAWSSGPWSRAPRRPPRRRDGSPVGSERRRLPWSPAHWAVEHQRPVGQQSSAALNPAAAVSHQAHPFRRRWSSRRVHAGWQPSSATPTARQAPAAVRSRTSGSLCGRRGERASHSRGVTRSSGSHSN